MRLWWEMAAALALAAVPAAQAPAAAPAVQGPIFTVGGFPDSADEADGSWFQLFGNGHRFLVPAGEERATYWRLMAEAGSRGFSLVVRYDASAGRLGAGGGHVAYPLCSIGVANGARFGNEARNCPPHPAGARGAEGLLALGLAQAFDFPEVARRTLAEALAAPGLPGPARAIALRARAEAAEAIGEEIEIPSHANDLLWVEALADFRGQVSLMPDDSEALFSVARALHQLGAYPEALQILQAIGRRWPERAFDVAVRTGALYRQQGDYRQALRQLDDFAAREVDPSNAGMKFHYHRAWTLTLLGRDAEAEVEVTRGLARQRDYASAYLLRSCARARLGRLAGALADQERGDELARLWTRTPGAVSRAEAEERRALIATLRAGVAAGNTTPVTTACGNWDRWSRPRPRSPLLAVTAPPA